jgi:dienelactone hydrolase
MHQILTVVFVSFLITSAAHAKIVVQEIDYKAGATEMAGWLAFDDSTTAKRPGIAVVQEWWGNNDYPKMRAQELAKLGYTAFAIDMYGKGKITDDPKTAGEWSSAVKKDPKIARERVEAGLNILKQQPTVDADKLGAIGYCFGGSVVLQMARWNEPVKAVVSFHGDLTPIEPAKGQSDVKVLVCNGEADSFVPPAAVEAFKKEMPDAKLINYPGAHHAFTNPRADEHHIENIAYNEAADKKSWEDMKAFFADVFGTK